MTAAPGTLGDQLRLMSCRKCGWAFAASDPDDEWSLTCDQGRVVAITCGDCMTSDQYLEGSANAAMYAMALDDTGLTYFVDPEAADGPP